MKINNIHHIAIIVGNYEQSKRFYSELLGFTIIRELYRAERDSYKLDLAVNGLYQIELFSFPETKSRASFPEAKGLRHLAFAVDNVAEWIDYLRANKVDVQDIRIDETTGRRFAFFNDPDGQPLELYENS
ncbi:VOC family protein [Parasediminibacterium paludis]|uniref:VOC family protein n=1 Tax=Parasediminibacterium paludis TaxID=908966 RepID=A0ABV8PVD5_9BACT